MKVTSIKTKSGKKLNGLQMQHLIIKLSAKLAKAGFITEVQQINPSSIKIGLHMKSFTVDVSKLGYNARIDAWSAKRSKKGYVRTSIPTWEQREQFNHLVNDVFDALKYSARIISGEYLIRDRTTGRVNEWTQPEGRYNPFSGEYQEHPLLCIVPESEAIKADQPTKPTLAVVIGSEVSEAISYKAAA